MPRKVNVVTTSFNTDCIRGSTMEEVMEKAVDIIDSCGGLQADLICLPEVFLKSGCTIMDGDYISMTSSAYNMLSEKAAAYHTYIVAGAHQTIEGRKFNVAWLFGRDGSLVGTYCKHHPTADEVLTSGVKPGQSIPVFQTDFGKVGLMICFDINWPDTWKFLADNGAEMVIWLSAYDGGFPLRMYAYLHSYYVISSVRTYSSRIIDITGEELASCSKWSDWAHEVIDLDKGLFHIDLQYYKIYAIQAALGNRVRVRSFSEENIFTLESFDPEWPMQRIIREFGLETCKDYLKQCENVQRENR